MIGLGEEGEEGLTGEDRGNYNKSFQKISLLFIPTNNVNCYAW